MWKQIKTLWVLLTENIAGWDWILSGIRPAKLGLASVCRPWLPDWPGLNPSGLLAASWPVDLMIHKFPHVGESTTMFVGSIFLLVKDQSQYLMINKLIHFQLLPKTGMAILCTGACMVVECSDFLPAIMVCLITICFQ